MSSIVLISKEAATDGQKHYFPNYLWSLSSTRIDRASSTVYAKYNGTLQRYYLPVLKSENGGVSAQTLDEKLQQRDKRIAELLTKHEEQEKTLQVIKSDNQNQQSEIQGLQSNLATKKDDFNENTAFNKNFGTGTGEVLEGSEFEKYKANNRKELDVINKNIIANDNELETVKSEVADLKQRLDGVVDGSKGIGEMAIGSTFVVR